jgi:hypothetical protein
MMVAKQVKEFFHSMGIHSTTIQLEYAGDANGYEHFLSDIILREGGLTLHGHPQHHHSVPVNRGL